MTNSAGQKKINKYDRNCLCAFDAVFPPSFSTILCEKRNFYYEAVDMVFVCH